MTYGQERVKKFMLAFGQKCPSRPTQLDEKTAKLRAALVLEEALELITKGLGLSINVSFNDDISNHKNININKADLKNNIISFSFEKEEEVNLAELADAVGDLFVVSTGTSLAAGIDQEEIDEDIFNSNDSKFWLKKDLDKIPENFKIDDIGDGFYIVRGENGKIAKPPTYTPANPQKFINLQLNKGKNQPELF